MPAGRIYVVNSPSYIAQLQRVPRVISFWYIEASVTGALGGLSPHASELILANAKGEKGLDSAVLDGMKASHDILLKSGLGPMTAEGVNRTRREMGTIKFDQGPRKLDLYGLVHHVTALAVSSAIYGAQNPYERPGLINDLTYVHSFFSSINIVN